MATVKLKIAELRKEKGIGQQDLADVLGVSFQSVSKWETGVTMPDITFYV
jgi:transcriptional regulator with XRE-family HTH domain